MHIAEFYLISGASTFGFTLNDLFEGNCVIYLHIIKQVIFILIFVNDNTIKIECFFLVQAKTEFYLSSFLNSGNVTVP